LFHSSDGILLCVIVTKPSKFANGSFYVDQHNILIPQAKNLGETILVS